MNKINKISKILTGALMFALTLCLAKAQPTEPQGTITGRAWLEMGGTGLAEITGSERFPDGFDVEVYLPYFEWNPSPEGDIFAPADNAYGDNYAAQIMGYFHPPASGDYTFWLSADDNADLWLSTDSDPANKHVIAREAGWSNARNWDSVGGGSVVEDKNSSSFSATEWPGGNTITLQAGEAYYIEAIVKEGGGGDNLAVAVEDPNGEIDPTLPIPGEYLSSIQPSGPVNIVTQPMGATVNALDPLTLSVEVAGTPPYAYQWKKDGADIEGATASSYAIDRLDNTHAGSYTAVVTGAEGSATSDAAVVAVNSDSEAPEVVSATGSESFALARVTFSEPIDPVTGGNKDNYSLSGGVNVTGATVGAEPNDHIVTLTTSIQKEGTMLTLTVNNVADLFGNSINADASMEFSTFIWQEGYVLHKFWQGTPNNIAGLIDDPRFPNSPDFVTLEPFWEYGPDGSNESGSNYGNQLVGWFVPPSDGEYIFFTSSDDPSDLFLSTDDDPANKLLIAREAGWSNARDWVGTGGGASNIDDKRSDFFADSEWPTFDISLEGGERYYLESLHTEGGGGDSVGATVIASNDADPASGDAPTLTGSLIGTYLDPNGASVNIIQQPADADVDEGTAATLSIVAEGTSAYGNTVNLQWQQAAAGSDDFTDIPGATGDSYETGVLVIGDSGLQFRVQLSVPTLSATSDVATLSVVKDVTPPRIASVTANSLNGLIVKFNEGIDAATGAVAGNFSLSDGVSISSASAAGQSVLLKTGSLTSDATYTLTVGGVKDLYGNAVPAGTSKSFVVSVVTYTDIILADEPIAFYRFEETGGMVAENFGTLGSDADGLWMSGVGPDDSIEWEVSNEEGPNPGEGFLGFGEDNLAASFNGDLDLLWIETQGQWLSNLDSFTLEYWVKPTNREGNGWNRVGIVGQNDAVEYGFINGTTIQIWTPGGGALNTTYEFPDDEWHHIATIADGSQIHNYFDGELINSAGSATSDYGAADFTVRIGGGGVYDGSGNHFEGGLDEVAIFDRAIPAERVKEHFTAGREGGSKAAPEVDPTISITSADDGSITIEFEGVLQSADTVNGAYSEVAGAASPFTVTADSPQKFYRSSQ